MRPTEQRSSQVENFMFRRRTDVYLDVLEVIEPETFAGESTVQMGNRAHEILEKGVEARKAAMSACRRPMGVTMPVG